MYPRLLALGLLVAPVAAPAEAPAPRAVLVELVRQDCGACHGLTLKGGLGPSLEPAALSGKDREFLAFVILNGRRGTAMPPWRGLLTEADAQSIAELLQKGLPR